MTSCQIAFQPGSYLHCADFQIAIAGEPNAATIWEFVHQLLGDEGNLFSFLWGVCNRAAVLGWAGMNRERCSQSQPNMNPCAVECGNHASWDIRDAQKAPWWPFTQRHSQIYSCDSSVHVKKLWLPCINIHHTEPTLTIFYLWKQFFSFFPRRGGITGINHAIRGLFHNATRKTLSQINLQMEEARLQSLHGKCQK